MRGTRRGQSGASVMADGTSCNLGAGNAAGLLSGKPGQVFERAVYGNHPAVTFQNKNAVRHLINNMQKINRIFEEPVYSQPLPCVIHGIPSVSPLQIETRSNRPESWDIGYRHCVNLSAGPVMRPDFAKVAPRRFNGIFAQIVNDKKTCDSYAPGSTGQNLACAVTLQLEAS